MMAASSDLLARPRVPVPNGCIAAWPSETKRKRMLSGRSQPDRAVASNWQNFFLRKDYTPCTKHLETTDRLQEVNIHGFLLIGK